MLAGQISNQDEDEVEDELAALEAEVNGGAKVQQPLPSVPDTQLPERREGLETPEREEPPAQAERREAMLA
jgi:charged multivesicular body protein 6